MDQVKRYLGALVAAALALCPLGAAAQDTDPGRREEPIRVQVSVNLFFAGATGESDEAAKLRELARRSIYEMASNECALVQQVLAKTCRLEAVNVSINAQVGGCWRLYRRRQLHDARDIKIVNSRRPRWRHGARRTHEPASSALHLTGQGDRRACRRRNRARARDRLRRRGRVLSP